jgi:hypothetical protein
MATFMTATKTKFDCPICEQPLWTQPGLGGRVDIWCGWRECKSLLANAGATADTVEEANQHLVDILKGETA